MSRSVPARPRRSTRPRARSRARRRRSVSAGEPPRMSSTFGHLFRLTTFGESHGPGVGVVVDGMPPGIRVDAADVQKELDRRRPGQSSITTQRKEADTVEIVSGVFDGTTLGTPITMLVRNTDQRSKDYDALKDVYRPGHADYVYEQKYGVRDHR